LIDLSVEVYEPQGDAETRGAFVSTVDLHKRRRSNVSLASERGLRWRGADTSKWEGGRRKALPEMDQRRLESRHPIRCFHPLGSILQAFT
jgi:hypothetical protein